MSRFHRHVQRVTPKRARLRFCDEPVLHNQGTVRTLTPPGLRTLRTTGGQGRELGRPALPHLLRARRPHLGFLPGLRRQPPATRPTTSKSGCSDLSRLRGQYPRLLLRLLRFEGCLLGGRLCECYTLDQALTQAVDENTGQLRPDLVPLRDGILGSQNLKRKLAWFGESRVPEVLGPGPRRPSPDTGGRCCTSGLAHRLVHS